MMRFEGRTGIFVGSVVFFPYRRLSSIWNVDFLSLWLMCPVGLLFTAVIMLVSISSLYSTVGARQGCDFVGSVCYI